MAVRTWTVDELCGAVAEAISVVFPDQVWVRGEIKGLRKSPAGHLYFDLIEPGAGGRGNDAKLGVVAFRGPLRGIEAVLAKVGNLRLEDGIEVRIRGNLDYYPPQGRVQFLMNAIDPRYTLGQLAADRDRVLQNLAAAGLLERNRLLPMPLVPLRVALVTSDDSAAFNDVISELGQSGFAFDVKMIDARVQGLDAEASLVRAVAGVGELDVDVAMVVRGGGAKTDLIAFDQEAVARAVATCPVPVLVGIGHEIDRSVVDEVAHSSLKTPTACAGAVIAAVGAFVDRLDEARATVVTRSQRSIDRTMHQLAAHSTGLARATRGSLRLADDSISSSASRLVRATDRALRASDRELAVVSSSVGSLAVRGLDRAAAALDRAPRQLDAHSGRILERGDIELNARSAVVNALHPDRTVARGFSITTDQSGRILRGLPAPGDQVHTSIAAGTFTSSVETTAPTETVDPGASARPGSDLPNDPPTNDPPANDPPARTEA